MADKKKILVLESEKLLTASITSLLSSRSELDVMTTAKVSVADWDGLERARPDVVIVEERLLAANLLEIVKLAESHPKVRLIVVGPANSNVQVFDKQMVQVRQVSDFLGLL